MNVHRLILFAMAATILCACGRPSDPPETAAAPAVIVIRPRRADAVRTLTLPGDLVGYYEAPLYAKVTGYLDWIKVDKGDWVKGGETLAAIEVPELEQRLDRARADLEIQRVTYERLKHVWESDPRLVAREDVDVAQGKYQEAKAQVDELAAMVGYTKIIAPFNGVVTARYVDPGALIKAVGEQSTRASAEASVHPSGASTPVVAVARIDKLRTYVYVPEREVSFIRRGMPATLTFAEFPGRKFRGKVVRFATSLDLSTRTMLTEVDIENPKRELYPGMYASVALELERHQNVLQLPPAALGNTGVGNFVYVVRGGRLVKQPVKTGIVTADYVEVVSGLRANARVVATMNPALSEGETVRPIVAQAGAPEMAGGERFAQTR
jgi:membrane fusion protein, multidrug efflux system